jgi:hypothetical protein
MGEHGPFSSRSDIESISIWIIPSRISEDEQYHSGRFILKAWSPLDNEVMYSDFRRIASMWKGPIVIPTSTRYFRNLERLILQGHLSVLAKHITYEH